MFMIHLRSFSFQVSLEIPDKLFGSSFSTVTNVSKIIGDLMTVSTALQRLSPPENAFPKAFSNETKSEREKLRRRAFSNFENVFSTLVFFSQSTTRRTAQFLWVFKPLFGNALKIEIPEPTTTTTEASK